MRVHSLSHFAVHRGSDNAALSVSSTLSMAYVLQLSCDLLASQGLGSHEAHA